MSYQPPLFVRGSIVVFEDIDLVDLERVPGLYPSAQGRLVQLLDDLNEAWLNGRRASPPRLPLEANDDDDYET